MPELTMEELTLALAVVAGAAFVCLLAVLVLALRLKKARRQMAVLKGDKGDQDLLTAVARAVTRVDEMDSRFDDLRGTQLGQTDLSRRAIQKFGVVRYDAFEEMGGRLSFSVALLDDHGDGIVFTSINGRTEARTYVKPVASYSSEHNLSDEEKEAIAIAVSNYGRSETRTPVKQAQ